MTISRSGNPARTNIPDYKPSRPVNATPAKGTGWAGYGASSRQRTEAARSHVDQSVRDLGDKWQNKVNKPANKPSGRAGASAPPESRRPQVEAKRADQPARKVFERAADSGRSSGTSKVTTTTRDEPLKPALAARTASLPLIDTAEEEEVLAPSFADKKPAPVSISPKTEILAAVQKLVNQKYTDTRSPVYVQGLVYERRTNPNCIELSGLVIVKKSVSEKLAKQHINDPDGLSAALDALGSTKTKTLKFSDAAGWKNTRLNAAIKKQDGDLKKLFKNMIADSASIQASHAPSFARQAMQFMLKDEYLKAEGIFRLAGGTAELNATQCSLVTSNTLEEAMPPKVDVKTPPDLLKRILAEMPQRLISGANKTEFLALGCIDNAESGKLQAYRQAIDKLAVADKELLGTLMRFLKTIEAEATINKMDAPNLGMVFSMVILEEEKDPTNIAKVRSNFEPIVIYMIQHANELFPDPNAATPSPKKAALAQVKDKAGAATLTKVKPANINGTGSAARTESTTAPTTSKASSPTPPVKKDAKQVAPQPALASPLKAAKASDVEKIYPNTSLRNAQSAVDAANSLMTHAAEQLGEDWGWKLENSPLRALLQRGIPTLHAITNRALFWTSYEDFLAAADGGELDNWLKKAVAEIKTLKDVAETVAKDLKASQSDVAKAKKNYTTALERFRTNQLDFTILYAAEALTKGMKGKPIEKLNEVMKRFGKKNPDGTTANAFDSFTPEEQRCLHDFYSGINTLLLRVCDRAPKDELSVNDLVKNLYIFGFSALGETIDSYLERAATKSSSKPLAAHLVPQKAAAMSTGLVTEPAKYLKKYVTA